MKKAAKKERAKGIRRATKWFDPMCTPFEN